MTQHFEKILKSPLVRNSFYFLVTCLNFTTLKQVLNYLFQVKFEFKVLQNRMKKAGKKEIAKATFPNDQMRAFIDKERERDRLLVVIITK